MRERPSCTYTGDPLGPPLGVSPRGGAGVCARRPNENERAEPSRYSGGKPFKERLATSYNREVIRLPETNIYNISRWMPYSGVRLPTPGHPWHPMHPTWPHGTPWHPWVHPPAPTCWSTVHHSRAVCRRRRRQTAVGSLSRRPVSVK